MSVSCAPRIIHWVVGVALLLSTALPLGSAERSGDAARVRLPATIHNCALRRVRTTTYFNSPDLDLIRVLPPPPGAATAAQQLDMEAVLAAQRNARRTGLTARAVGDSLSSCSRFADVLGPRLSHTHAPLALAFMDRAASLSSGATVQGKRYWWRQRPYMVNSAVQRLADVADPAPELPDDPLNTLPSLNACAALARGEGERGPDGQRHLPGGSAPPITRERDEVERDHTSYPSGHSAFGYSCGVLLADMVPEKRGELMLRAIEYGQARSVVGAHYPTDVAAGQTVAAVANALMQQSAAFRRDFEAARRELRAALGLSVEAPDMTPELPNLTRAARAGAP